MFRYLVAFAASTAVVLAQTLTINTPQGVLACTNTQVSWTGGTPPYILQIQPGGDTSAAAIETFTGIAASPFTWHVIESANTQVFLRLRDANGVPAESGTFTIQSAGSAVCSGTTGGTSQVGATTPAAGATTAAATTPAAGATTTPAAGATTPAAGATTPAASGSSSATHASSTTTSHNGASAAQVAGGLVGLVGAVAVALA